MALRFYLAGEASSDHGDNWRGTIVDSPWTHYPMMFDVTIYDDDLVEEGALPGGFDYAGAYIESKGHCAYGLEQEFAVLHRRCIDLCDVLWVWATTAGEGTWAEVGYAAAKNIPVVFAYQSQHDPDRWEEEGTTFIEAFASSHKAIYAPTAREAWDKFAAAPMRYMRYTDYLNTPHWQRIRQAMYQEVPKLCQRCGSDQRVQLHHLTYERVGREAWGDLVPLCSVCHQREHALEAHK